MEQLCNLTVIFSLNDLNISLFGATLKSFWSLQCYPFKKWERQKSCKSYKGVIISEYSGRMNNFPGFVLATYLLYSLFTPSPAVVSRAFARAVSAQLPPIQHVVSGPSLPFPATLELCHHQFVLILLECSHISPLQRVYAHFLQRRHRSDPKLSGLILI